jgi:hypothetical protein
VRICSPWAGCHVLLLNCPSTALYFCDVSLLSKLCPASSEVYVCSIRFSLLSDDLPSLINRVTTATQMAFSDALRTGSGIAPTKSMIFYLFSTLLLERFFVIPHCLCMRGLKDHTYYVLSLLYIASLCTFIRLSKAGSENYSVLASLQQATQLFCAGVGLI